jgi:hypothetical protein
MDESLDVVRAELAEKIAAIPAGKDGADGEPGRPGEKGADGKNVSAEQMREVVDAVVAQLLACVPTPKDGNDGTAGADGNQGPPGQDGKSITLEDVLPVLESMQAKWALDFERRAQALFQDAIKTMPKPKDGNDGLGFDDLTVERKDFRHYVLRFTRGDQVKEFNLDVPMLVYRGVYKRDEDYSVGDLVSWGGHMYHRDEPQAERRVDPDKTASGWTQCVKRGNDGSSAYASAVKHGFSGSEKDWIDSVGKPAQPRTVKV